jgi:hypothetical protein
MGFRLIIELLLSKNYEIKKLFTFKIQLIKFKMNCFFFFYYKKVQSHIFVHVSAIFSAFFLQFVYNKSRTLVICYIICYITFKINLKNSNVYIFFLSLNAIFTVYRQKQTCLQITLCSTKLVFN